YCAADVIVSPSSTASQSTGFPNDLAHAATTRTGLRHLEKAPRTDHLPATAAGRAIDRTRARLGAGAVALIAGVEFADLDFFFRSEGCFLQSDLHVVTQIGAALPFVGATSSTATKEALENPATASSKNLAENIEWIVEPAAKSGSSVRKSAVPVSVVGSALIGIH